MGLGHIPAFLPYISDAGVLAPGKTNDEQAKIPHFPHPLPLISFRAVSIRVQLVRLGHSNAGYASNPLRGGPTVMQEVSTGLVSLHNSKSLP